MNAQVVSQEPPSAEEAARAQIVFSPTHSSRYNWGSRNALPPRLSRVSRLLGKLARKHSDFPGYAVDLDGLKKLIAHAIEEELGAADDYVRALKNFAILVSAFLPDGTAVTLYDQLQMDRAVAFQDGGVSLTEPSLEQVKARGVELLTCTLTDDESPPPSSDDQNAPVAEGGSSAWHIPDIDDIVLKLDEAKQTISLPDGAGTLEDVVVNPLAVLKNAFRECDPDRLQALLSRVATRGYLAPLGKGVYRITLEPEAVSKWPTARGGDPSNMDRAFEDEQVQLRIARRKAEADILEMKAGHERERKELAENEQKKHESEVNGDCDKVREAAEKAFEIRCREICAKRDPRIREIIREIGDGKMLVDLRETLFELRKVQEELLAETEKQTGLIRQAGEQAWPTKRERLEQEQQDRATAELRPLSARVEELAEREALYDKLREMRKKPIT